jgi:uncharacterized protein
LTEALKDKEAANKRREGRTRMCAVARAVLPESQLIRFVAAPDGTVVADLKARLPGRGIWVGATRGAVAEAVKRNVFSRGLKEQLRPPADLPDQVAARLKEHALGRLGLARKAGAVLAGFSKVEAAIANEGLAALVIASDAAADGVRKIMQAVTRRFGSAVPIPVIRFFSAAELGLAIGRPDVIHAAVLQGPAGGSFVEAANRLQHYSGVSAGEAGERAAEPLGLVDERYDE